MIDDQWLLKQTVNESQQETAKILVTYYLEFQVKKNAHKTVKYYIALDYEKTALFVRLVQ